MTAKKADANRRRSRLTSLGRTPREVADELRELLGFAAADVDALSEGNTGSPQWNDLRAVLLSLATVANEVASLDAARAVKG